MAKKKGKLRHIRIEPAANGYTVHAHHEPPQSKGSEMPMSPMDEKPAVFTNKEDVMNHVGGLLADNEGSQSSPEDGGDDDVAPMRGAFGRKKK